MTGRNILLGFQHVFAMFGATVLVPLTTGLNVSTTLLAAGLGTLLFHFLTKGKVPAFLGSSFAFLGGYALVAPKLLDPATGEYTLANTEMLPYACGGVPLLRELAKAVSFSPSLSAAVENEYVQPIGLSQTKNGITATMEYVIVDQKQVNIFYTLKGEGYETLSAEFPAFIPEQKCGVIGGGMLPKLGNCTSAIRNGVNRVHILDGRIPHCMLLEIFTNQGIGTAIIQDGDT